MAEGEEPGPHAREDLPREGPPRERRPDADPDGGEWRADALAASQHSRLDAEMRPPAEDYDGERAAALCAGLARDLLADFAPGMMFLAPEERRRAQALLAYGRTLFDFARQRGVEGQRLAEINRFEFTLETALSGKAVGQPIFVAMAEAHARQPWPEAALDGLAAAARRRATRERPGSPGEADADAERLAAAAVGALLGAPPAPELAAFAAALVRLHALQNLGPEARANRLALPRTEVPAGGDAPVDPGLLVAAAHRECQRLRPRLLGAPRGLVDLPEGYRRAAVFALLAGLRLLSRIEDGGGEILAHPPRLGLLARLALLAQARFRLP
jgi:phytoene/squalene synthetase